MLVYTLTSIAPSVSLIPIFQEKAVQKASGKLILVSEVKGKHFSRENERHVTTNIAEMWSHEEHTGYSTYVPWK